MDIVRIVTEALRSQDQIQRRIPISRQTVIGLQLSEGFFQNQYTWERLASFGRILSVFVSRITIDLYWDYSSQVWQLCPFVFPPNSIIHDSNKRDQTVTLNGNVCSRYRLTLDDILDKTSEWVRNKTGTSQEHPITVVLNLNDLNTSGPASNSSQRQLSSTISLAINKTQFVYTPRQIQNDRAATSNGSSQVLDLTSPYFASSVVSSGAYPTGTQLIAQKKLIMVVFGDNNLPQSTTYNISNDFNDVFPSTISTLLKTNQLYPPAQFTCARPGPNIAMNGTGFDLSDPRYSVASPQPNDRVVSWNFAVIQDSPERPLDADLASQLFRCGFSLQFTKNYTAELLNATLWSWEYLEPSSNSRKRCTIMSRNDTKWETEFCDTVLPISCQRIQQNPYDWQIQFPVAGFPNTSAICSPPYEFSVPRTPQEQQALANALLASNASKVWINLRKSSPSCWVSNSSDSCPSLLDESLLVQQLIGSNLKQGIIILLILIFFLIYQCRAQYKLNKEYQRKMAVRRKVKTMQRHCVPRSKKHMR